MLTNNVRWFTILSEIHRHCIYNRAMSGGKTMARLNSYAEIKNGQILSRYCLRESTDGEEIKVITPSSISNSVINHNNLGVNYLRDSVDKEKLMYPEEGDIVIKLSTPYDSAIVRKQDVDLVIPSFCALIRCHNPEDNKFILAVLNNRRTIDYLTSNISGQGMRIIKIGSIRDIEIPEMSAEHRKEIGELYWQSRLDIELHERYIENEKAVVNKIISDYLGGNKDGKNREV